MRKFAFLLLLSLTTLTSSFAQKKKQKDALKPIDSITQKMEKNSGLITTYLNDESQLYFEINEGLLNEDLLVVTRFSQLPANYSAYLNAGSKTAEQVVRFVKKGKKILLKQISFSNIATEEDPIALSVAENNFAPILAAFENQKTPYQFQDSFDEKVDYICTENTTYQIWIF